MNKLLQGGNGSHDIEFNACFGVVDQGFGYDHEWCQLGEHH